VEPFKHKNFSMCAVQQKKILCFQLVTIMPKNEPERALVFVHLRKSWCTSAHQKAQRGPLEKWGDAPI
jgi:hypothetical protein